MAMLFKLFASLATQRTHALVVVFIVEQFSVIRIQHKLLFKRRQMANEWQNAHSNARIQPFAFLCSSFHRFKFTMKHFCSQFIDTDYFHCRHKKYIAHA